MKTKFTQSNKVHLLVLFGLVPLVIGEVIIITTGIERPAVGISAEQRWKEYERNILSACYSGVSLPSEKLCEWDIITRDKTTVYIWAFCADANGQGSSGPVVINISTTGDVEKAICPLVFDEYKMLFPGELYDEILSYRDRFDLDKAWQHLELRFQDRTVPPLIVVSGTPLP